MSDGTPPSDRQSGTSSQLRDVARRIEVRRVQLGLSMEEVANRAGMTPRYLERLEDLGSDFDPGGLLRVAAALHMTYPELLEGRTDAPPGQQAAATHPALMNLTAEECWDRLGTHGIGRVALPVHPGPAVLPVNYLVDNGTIVYRTKPGGAAAAAAGSEVSFEVDHVDKHISHGWSVLIIGTAEHITDPDTVGHLAEQPGAEPWAGGRRDLYVRITPDSITGREIRTEES